MATGRMRHWLRAVCLGVGLVAGGPLFAADPGDVIVVTATRQAAALIDQPGTVARIDRETIAAVQADHPAELLNRIAGVNIHRNSGQEHLTAIRSPVLTGGAGAGSFLFLEDGVPLRAAGFGNVNGLFESVVDLAGGVEVVRGPGSVLYGSNAVHGLINVLTPAPLDRFGGSAEITGGSFGRVAGQGIVSGSDGTNGFLAGIDIDHEGGWRDDAGTDQQKLLLRWDREQGAVRIRTTLAAHNLNQETAGFIQGPDAYKNSALSRTNPNPEAYRDTRAVRLQSRIDWQADEDVVLSVTPYARWNEMTFLQHFLPYQGLEENGHQSVGVLTAGYWSFEGGHSLILGADAEVTDGFLKETQDRPTFGPFPQGVHYDFDVLSTVVAGYARGEWQAGERLRLTAGLRLDYTHYDYTNNTDADTIGRFKRPADRTDEFLVAKPEIGAVYRLNDSMSLFARYARGARAPQVTDLYRLQSRQTIGDVDTETLDSIEGGVRGGLGGIRFDLVAFAAEKDNFFFRDTDGLNVPDGRTRHVGFEYDVTVPLFDTLDLAAAGTYARHTYRFDNDVTANATEAIAFGDDVDSAPRVLSTVRAIWRPFDTVQAELSWTHMGGYFMDASNSIRYPGHDVFDLRGSWDVTGAVTVFGAIRNLTNTDYANRADFFFGNERYFPGEDRGYSGGVRVRF